MAVTMYLKYEANVEPGTGDKEVGLDYKSNGLPGCRETGRYTEEHLKDAYYRKSLWPSQRKTTGKPFDGFYWDR